MPKKKLQVFISSTYLDLVEERQAAVAAILKAGHIPAGMELFTAGDESQWDTITRWIDESDIYMLILGGRYGSTHHDTGVGYTEMEYDYAISKKKPHFAVVINEKALDERVKSKGKDVLELKHPEKLAKFRTKVLSKISTFFADSKDIRLAIHETIPTLESKHLLAGWISGSDFNDAKPLIDELSKLAEENRRLKIENEGLSKKLTIKPRPETEEFEELWDLLDGIMVDVSDIDPAGELKNKKVSLLTILNTFRKTLATGITNPHGMDDMDKFLYFTACPELEVHELVMNEKVASAKYRRYSLTQRGKRFLAYIDKQLIKNKPSAEVEAKKK
jgi:hypothetical protein